MSGLERREAEARRLLLAGPRPPVPADLAARAAGQGRRLLRGRRFVRGAAWLLLVAAVVALCALTAVAGSSPGAAPPPPGW
ncbi:hypothetical protein GCM10010218_49190 [Streptomyces mashuensis]|uniref:Uncharacterized protein n=1 Tax=Streptomyces mashuensis TaxID=33904 RepID=A0A919B7B1_9ACTN|nr:hypothetical protein [Streptomyces mashuensis]GHF61786.1 hypothetical protein GCM10010218_49190 [Streptomyces mashuensis]